MVSKIGSKPSGNFPIPTFPSIECRCVKILWA